VQKSRGSSFRKRPAPLRSPARSKRLIDNMEEIERRLVELEPAIPLGRISYPLKDLRRHIQKICKALSKQRDRSRRALSKPNVDQDSVDQSVRAQRKLIEELLKKEFELIDRIAGAD
jgi:hypothetical protein